MLSAHNGFLIAVNVGVLAGVIVLTTPQASLFSPAGRIGLTGTPGGWAPKSVVLQADNGRGGEEPEGIPRPDPPAPMVVTDGTQPADRLSPTLLLRIVGLGLVTLKVDEPRRLTSPPAVDPASSSRMGSDDGGGTPYIFSRRDNICGMGVKNPASITRPATVNYEALLAETDEVRKINKDRIDPQSAEGLKLMTGAKRKVLKACEEMRWVGNYCGIWKKITRRDGRRITDITGRVWAAMRGA
jgi:hypothetical protein